MTQAEGSPDYGHNYHRTTRNQKLNKGRYRSRQTENYVVSSLWVDIPPLEEGIKDRFDAVVDLICGDEDLDENKLGGLTQEELSIHLVQGEIPDGLTVKEFVEMIESSSTDDDREV